MLTKFIRFVDYAAAAALFVGAAFLIDPLGDQLRLWFPTIF